MFLTPKAGDIFLARVAFFPPIWNKDDKDIGGAGTYRKPVGFVWGFTLPKAVDSVITEEMKNSDECNKTDKQKKIKAGIFTGNVFYVVENAEDRNTSDKKS